MWKIFLNFLVSWIKNSNVILNRRFESRVRHVFFATILNYLRSRNYNSRILENWFELFRILDSPDLDVSHFESLGLLRVICSATVSIKIANDLNLEKIAWKMTVITIYLHTWSGLKISNLREKKIPKSRPG